MTITRLEARAVERVWGATDLPAWVPSRSGDASPIGEVWFEAPDAGDDALLIKYLFTREALSIQVHPDDGLARSLGHPRGKDEAWLVLDARPGATIGLGLRHEVTKAELRAAAQDGSIEELIDWRLVASGDMIYVPAGTIHAIGPGMTLLEIQQNADITFRLYDYGRPRALHLDEAVAAAHPAPFSPVFVQAEKRRSRLQGTAFAMERLTGPAEGMVAASATRPAWLIPLAGAAAIGGRAAGPGSGWRIEAAASLALDEGADAVVARPAGDGDGPIFTAR